MMTFQATRWLLSDFSLSLGVTRVRACMCVPCVYVCFSSALSAVRPGGIVVYSTCTLSSAENQSVMEAVLSTVHGVELAELEGELIVSLSGHFKFAHLRPPLGCLVVPEQGRTWGPMYVCRLRRTC